MKKRLAALGLSAMVFGAVVLPATPAQAGHCGYTPWYQPQEKVACTFEHVAECVAGLIREGRCGDPA